MGIYKFKDIINNFEEKCIIWGNQYKNLKFIFNNDLKELAAKQIKYILIADNPGQIEAAKGRYLVGPAGISARIFFERFFVNNFNKQVLVLNKTPIYTNTTAKLKEIDDKILEETQTFIVSMINNLYKILKVPVIISGFAGCHISNGGFLDKFSGNKNAVGKFFFSSLKNIKFGQENEDLFIIKHFSRLSIFDDFSIEIYNNYLANNNYNILNIIGTKYRKELYKKD